MSREVWRWHLPRLGAQPRRPGLVLCTDCDQWHSPRNAYACFEWIATVPAPSPTESDVQPSPHIPATPITSTGHTGPAGDIDMTPPTQPTPADITTACGLPAADAVLLSGTPEQQADQAAALLARYRAGLIAAAGLPAADVDLITGPTLPAMVLQAERLQQIDGRRTH